MQHLHNKNCRGSVNNNYMDTDNDFNITNNNKDKYLLLACTILIYVIIMLAV